MNFKNEIANTLFIPLTMKALENRKKNGLFKDKQADDIIKKLGIPLPNMETIHKGTQIGTAVRVKSLDQQLELFLNNNPNGVVITLGCGLDNRLLRLKRKSTHALNIDLPEVIKIREQYVKEASNLVINKGFSILEPQCFEYIKETYRDKPKIFIAEGILLYFNETQVLKIFNSILNIETNIVPNNEIWFDSHTKEVNDFMNTREDFKKLGVTFNWWLDKPSDLKIKKMDLIKRMSFMEQYPKAWGDLIDSAPDIFRNGVHINGYKF
ncbi:class I SAM-dependent methyltransferase [Salmonella enterica]